MSTQPFDIQYVSSLDDVDPENDNIDVHVRLRDGRVYSFLIATPNNIYKCMSNDGNEYFFGTPPVFVRSLDRTHVEEALGALLSEYGGRWLEIYGILQSEAC
jgi:hypothetical protein